MAKPLVADELGERIQPLLPPPKPRRQRYPGRKPRDNRKALTGILLVLKSGIPWEMLPQEMGCSSGMTCWRRLRDWQQAGVWQQLHELPASDERRIRAISPEPWWIAPPSGQWVAGEKTGPNPQSHRPRQSRE
jgi:transposase